MKTIVVTGASSGVGWALAIRAARAGYAVYAVGRNHDALAALQAKIEGEFGIVRVDATDIADPANAAALIARVLNDFGSIDVLVNNAGFVSIGPLAAQSDAELQRQFGTHVIGPIALVREALPALRAARGHVFMLGSGVARVPIGGLGAYPPAKAAIRSATAILRRELAPDGIAVTYVDPGAVDTPFMKRAGMPGAPAGLLTSPETVARKILVAVGTRPRVINAVPWQTAAVGFAEFFPTLTDALLERTPGLIGGEQKPALPGSTAAVPAALVASPAELAAEVRATPADAAGALTNEATVAALELDSGTGAESTEQSPFEVALEPHRRRMDKLNLRESFVRDMLVRGTTLDVGEVALRWAGMPNKNERAITQEVLDALATAGFLERITDDSFRVVRSA